MSSSTGKAIMLKDYQLPDYLVDHVDLAISLDAVDTKVVSKVIYRRGKNTPVGKPLVLDGDELQFVRARLNGSDLGNNSFAADVSRFELFVPPDEEAFELEITTSCAPSKNTKLMGLFQSNGVFCTQCESEGFRRISYYPDRPDVLATYTTRIEASKSEAPQLLGNGNLVEKGELPGGRHFAIWHDPHPKPSYLFALVGGDLGRITDSFATMSGRKVDLAIYVEIGKENRALYAMDALKRSMKWDEEVFGCEYDLDIFNIVAVSDFNMGAMENKGLNVFNDRYVLADAETATDLDYANIEAIIAHEYFHNWTGNRITCRDWFQLCLKEGLTVYRDQEFSSDMRSCSVVRIARVRRLQAAQFPEDGGPLAHPVRPASYQEINNLYTATVYEKGAELVRMIATIVGESGFRKGMDLYFERHDGEAAQVEDFLAAFEDANDVDLGQFALWYSQAGTPQVTVSANYHRTKKTCELEFEQSLAATPGQSRKKLMHIPVRVGLVGKNGADLAIDDVKGGKVVGDIVHLTRRNTRLTFNGINERPVISLLRGFSAPVSVEFNQSKQDRLFLARHDGDLFNRWQALQKLALDELMLHVGSTAIGEQPKFDDKLIEIYASIVDDTSLEPAFRAHALVSPGEMEIAQALGKNIDPDAIHSVQLAFVKAIGAKLGETTQSRIEALATPGPYSSAAEPAGKRSLKNVLLAIHANSGRDDALLPVRAQFESADNMTDKLTAFALLAHNTIDPSQARKAQESFYQLYRHDPLVLDKWLTVLATIPGIGALDKVQKLMSHTTFSLTNPNRVRSLIGAYVAGNPTGFHREDGKGYDFLADITLELDAINPQVAARLLTAMRSWRMLESQRRKLAGNALERLAAAELSNDVRDIANRSLEQ